MYVNLTTISTNLVKLVWKQRTQCRDCLYMIIFVQYFNYPQLIVRRYLSEGFQVIVEKSKESKCSLKDIQLRFLCPDDLEEVIDVKNCLYDDLCKIRK